MTAIDTSTEAVKTLFVALLDEAHEDCVFVDSAVGVNDTQVQLDRIAAARDLVPALLKERDDLRAKLAVAAEVQALVELAEELITAVWHLMDNSEESGPIEDPKITVWKPDFDEVSAILDRIEGLPSGSIEHMTAGELFAANILVALRAFGEGEA